MSTLKQTDCTLTQRQDVDQDKDGDRGSSSKIRKWAEVLLMKLPSQRISTKEGNDGHAIMRTNASSDEENYENYSDVNEKRPLFASQKQILSNFDVITSTGSKTFLESHKEDDFSCTIETATATTLYTDGSPATSLKSAAVMRRLRRRPPIQSNLDEETVVGILRLEADTLEMTDNSLRVSTLDSHLSETMVANAAPVVFYSGTSLHEDSNGPNENHWSSDGDQLVSGRDFRHNSCHSTVDKSENCNTSDDDDSDNQSEPSFVQLDVPTMVKMMQERESLQVDLLGKDKKDMLSTSTHSHASQHTSFSSRIHRQLSESCSSNRESHYSNIPKPKDRKKDRIMQPMSMKLLFGSDPIPSSSRSIQDEGTEILYDHNVSTLFPNSEHAQRFIVIDDRRSSQSPSSKSDTRTMYEPLSPEETSITSNSSRKSQFLNINVQCLSASAHNGNCLITEENIDQYQKSSFSKKETTRLEIGVNSRGSASKPDPVATVPNRVRKGSAMFQRLLSEKGTRSSLTHLGKVISQHSHEKLHDDIDLTNEQEYSSKECPKKENSVMKSLIEKAIKCAPNTPSTIFQKAASHHGKGHRPSRTKGNKKVDTSIAVKPTVKDSKAKSWPSEDSKRSSKLVMEPIEKDSAKVSSLTVHSSIRQDHLPVGASSDLSLPDADGQKQNSLFTSKMIPDMAWIRQISTNESDHNLTISTILNQDKESGIRPVKSYDDRIDFLWEKQQEQKRRDRADISFSDSGKKEGSDIAVTKAAESLNVGIEVYPEEVLEMSSPSHKDDDYAEKATNSEVLNSQGQIGKFTIRSTALSFGKNIKSGQKESSQELSQSTHSKMSNTSSKQSGLSRINGRRRPTTSAFLKRQSVFSGHDLLKSEAETFVEYLEGRIEEKECFDDVPKSVEPPAHGTPSHRFNKDIRAAMSCTTINTNTRTARAVAEERFLNAMIGSYVDESDNYYTEYKTLSPHYTHMSSTRQQNVTDARDRIRSKHMISARRPMTIRGSKPIPCEFPSEIIIDRSSNEERNVVGNAAAATCTGADSSIDDSISLPSEDFERYQKHKFTPQ